MKILLDTNFIITSIREKIDFFSLANGLFDELIEWIVPQDVLNELGNIKDSKGSNSKDRESCEIAFELLRLIDPKIVNLPGKNPNIDIKIVNYLLDNPKTVLATLDKELKERVSNKILTIRGKKSLEIL
jgi:rRNA-processing protein FCF1